MGWGIRGHQENGKAMRRTPFAANIIVSNLPDNFSGGELASLFDDFGLVLGAVIDRPGGGGSAAARGMVNLAPPKAVETAISSLDGKVVESHHLRVRKAPPQPVRPRRAKPHAALHNGPPRPYFAEDPAMPAPAPSARPARTVIVERRPLGRRLVNRPLGETAALTRGDKDGQR